MSSKTSEVRAALLRCRGAFWAVALMSGLVNLLYLTGSFFMLQVYDRVLPSRSLPTLIGLLVLALALYAFQGLIDFLRTRILCRVGTSLDHSLSQRMFNLLIRAPLRFPDVARNLQPLRDLDSVRSFLSGNGPVALFDLPWMPLYLGVCAVFHPLIGLAALGGCLVLIAFTLVTDRLTAAASHRVSEHGAHRHGLAETGRRNAEALAAMGMQERFGARWSRVNSAYLAEQQRVADVSGGFGAASKMFRAGLQSAVLALGAWLVIRDEATAGIIIASSILTARAMAPAELAIANWKGLVQARQAWRRLKDLCERIPAVDRPMALPAPCRSLTVEAASVHPPGVSRLVVQDLSLSVSAGQGLGVIGPSASGKSSLARALVGVWPCLQGQVRLDGADLAQWSSQALGEHVGYLPQEVELFAGTIAQNIARFGPEASAESVIAAAKAAGVHEMVVQLPGGYDMILGENGSGLSAGQRQRIGLARALFGQPFLVVLDEPNSNLDGEGEQALTLAIAGVRARGGICVVIAHRPSALAALDLVLVMAGGRVAAFGPKNDVLMRVLQSPPGEAEAPPAQAPAASGGGDVPLTAERRQERTR